MSLCELLPCPFEQPRLRIVAGEHHIVDAVLVGVAQPRSKRSLRIVVRGRLGVEHEPDAVEVHSVREFHVLVAPEPEVESPGGDNTTPEEADAFPVKNCR